MQRRAIGRRLMDDIHAMLSSYLEDTFCCFLDDKACLAPADTAVQLAGRRLGTVLWWNLDGGQSPVGLRLLPLLAEELAPGSTRWLGPLKSSLMTTSLVDCCALEPPLSYSGPPQ